MKQLEEYRIKADNIMKDLNDEQRLKQKQLVDAETKCLRDVNERYNQEYAYWQNKLRYFLWELLGVSTGFGNFGHLFFSFFLIIFHTPTVFYKVFPPIFFHLPFSRLFPILIPEMYICSVLSANTNINTNTFVKNKEIQILVKILPKNVFENTKNKYFSNNIL